jgi:hypothetical protein
VEFGINQSCAALNPHPYNNNIPCEPDAQQITEEGYAQEENR